MEKIGYDRNYNRIKLMAIISLIAFSCFAVADAVHYYDENFFNHFHPHGDLEYCDRGHFVYYLTNVLIYISLIYMLIMVPASIIINLKAIRTFSITNKHKKIILYMTISQSFFIILTLFFIYIVSNSTIYAFALTLLIWLFNSCYVWYSISRK